MAIEANFKKRGRFYPATIHQIRSDGTYDISYDDGDIELSVEEEAIIERGSIPLDNDKKPPWGSTKVATVLTYEKCTSPLIDHDIDKKQVGMKVMVRAGSVSFYYLATISQVGNNTIDVLCDN